MSDAGAAHAEEVSKVGLRGGGGEGERRTLATWCAYGVFEKILGC